ATVPGATSHSHPSSGAPTMCRRAQATNSCTTTPWPRPHARLRSNSSTIPAAHSPPIRRSGLAPRLLRLAPAPVPAPRLLWTPCAMPLPTCLVIARSTATDPLPLAVRTKVRVGDSRQPDRRNQETDPSNQSEPYLITVPSAAIPAEGAGLNAKGRVGVHDAPTRPMINHSERWAIDHPWPSRVLV